MKKQLLMLSVCTLLYNLSFSQGSASPRTISPSPTVEKCSQHLRMEELRQQDPDRYSTVVTGMAEPKQSHYSPSSTEKTTGLIYTIPVVFHVLHNNGAENISDNQILDALAILNRDYRRLNADADQVQAVFQGMPSDAEVEFKLATVAPNGACFDGITRTVSTLTSDGSDGQAQVQAIVNGNNIYQGVWAHNKYLNIYIAGDIGGAAGYTFLPNGNSAANVTNMYYNGIFILHDYCGSIGTGSVGASRALTHEVGHWMNLDHVWGNGNNPGNASSCSIDDGVQDTPNCIGVTSCSLNSNTCNSDDAYWGSAMKDNVENYMDYSYCSKMYTQGQVTKMRVALTSSVGGRSNISTLANLQLVGAISGGSLCSIDFTTDQNAVCAGTTITFTPNTSSGISNYSWTFPGGTPASSTAASPVITYNTPGTYNATLTVTGTSNGLNYTESKTSYVIVNAGTTSSLPLTEGFTTATFPPAGWSVVNANASATWVRNATIGHAPSAGNSMMFDNYNTNDSGYDEVRVKALDLSLMSSSQLSFDVAYAPYDAGSFDGLEVLVSTNCGGTFTSVYLKSNTVLATAPASTSLFTPTNAQWRNDVIDLTPFAGQSTVIVAFRNLAGYGNRLFIDNINITGVSATPNANFSSSASSTCTGQSITITDASSAATSWSWNFGVGATPATATTQGPHTVTYASSGVKTIQLTINGSLSTTQNVTVNVPPSSPTISANGATTFCAGNNVVLTSSSASGNSWSNNSTGQSTTISTSGNYTVTYTDANGCSATSTATAVTVNPLPTVTFGALADVCDYDSPVSLTQGSPVGGTYSGNGVSGTQFDPSVSGLGTTILTYSYTNGNGCTGSSTSNIVVDACLSLNESGNSTITIFPNPSTGILNVDPKGASISEIHVYDYSGRLVFLNKEIESSEPKTIDLSNLSQGVYTVKVLSGSSVVNVPVVIYR